MSVKKILKSLIHDEYFSIFVWTKRLQFQYFLSRKNSCYILHDANNNDIGYKVNATDNKS